MGVNTAAMHHPRVVNAALFATANRAPSFRNMLTGAAPKGTSEIGKTQTDPGAPIVRVTDLEKQAGQEVSVDIVHQLTRRPTMGDTKLEGRGDSMTFASDDMKVNQYRHMLDNGGRMAEKGTNHSLKQVARSLLGEYHRNLTDELVLYHLAGARGDLVEQDFIIPTADHPEFNQIMVNKLLAPTHDRHFYGGDADSLESLDSADLFNLDVVDRLWLTVKERGTVMRHLQLQGDKMADEDPMFLLLVSPRQWNDFYTSTSGKDWNQFMAQASARGKGFNHPLFAGECLKYRNILIRPMTRRVRFSAGSKVEVSQNNRNATTELLVPGVNVERAMLLGAQALGDAYARVDGVDSHAFKLHQEKVDHGNAVETSIAWVNGLKKLRFRDRDGFVRDHGVMVADTAVRQ